MRWKYAKLLGNLGNSLDAAVGRVGRQSDLYQRARAEAEACYEAGAIDYAADWETQARYEAARSGLGEDGPLRHQGSSSWQSLKRATGTIEADWLNGEVVLLALTYSVPTPVNSVLRGLANYLARHHVPPASLTLAEVEAMVERFEATSASATPRSLRTA